ncbi:ABC transporter permease [Pseudoduganella namucuonensis]|uniref:Nucleoside ABC transporter membrane protein n=1 Tax=Pseudoduganella namucuonensis TaxID=1035707 RepID=A0A1I7K8Z9_9BURK|nr:ABC transporter permease [Pseudoduganella namucuonensis]SFU93845.1 nucleoside ABC transporter membrane protein [Pseudoduganella namucuonensis]
MSPVQPRLLIAVLAALLAGLLLTALASREPVHAYLSLLTGALPQPHWDPAQGWQVRRLARFGTVLEDAVTLTFLGLAVALPFRARQFSLGADGQMFLGALAAAAVSLYLGGPAWLVLPAAALAAMLAGFAWGLLPGLLKARHGANEMVSSLMLNLIAIEFYRLAITRWLCDPAAGFLVTPMLPAAATFAPLLAHTNVTPLLFAAPLAAYAAWLLLARTTAGYEIRLTGAAPAFARQAGLPVGRAVALSMAAGGAFAGLAGLHIGNGLLKRLPVDLAPGLGYDGLLVALLARNDPRAVPWAALFYAYLRTGAQAMERGSDVSREMVLVIQALIILFVVADRLLPRRLELALRRRRGEGQ